MYDQYTMVFRVHHILVRRLVATAAGAFALLALAVTGVAVAEGLGQSGTETAPPPDIRALGTGATLDALPASVDTSVDSGLRDTYGLDTSAARAVHVPASHELHARWIVIPGTHGLCVAFVGASSTTCGGTATFRDRGLLMRTLPPAPGRLDLAPGVLNHVDRADVVGPGPETVRGIAPDRFVHAVAVDASGAEVADAGIVDNVYELSVPDARAGATIELVTASGERTVVAGAHR